MWLWSPLEAIWFEFWIKGALAMVEICPLIDHRQEPIKMREWLGLLYKIEYTVMPVVVHKQMHCRSTGTTRIYCMYPQITVNSLLGPIQTIKQPWNTVHTKNITIYENPGALLVQLGPNRVFQKLSLNQRNLKIPALDIKFGWKCFENDNTMITIWLTLNLKVKGALKHLCHKWFSMFSGVVWKKYLSDIFSEWKHHYIFPGIVYRALRPLFSMITFCKKGMVERYLKKLHSHLKQYNSNPEKSHLVL